jgi:hypothetical protein
VRGLTLALDVATGGAVTGGEVLVVEDFRLRRTFATILGANLADADDPLLAGTAVSGNSYLGDTLFLGAEHNQEFLALFGAGLPLDKREQAALTAFFDALAYRVTVLVHEEVEPQDLGLIRRVVDQEVPAHVLGRVVTASAAFVVGMASLVGVDSYLETPVRAGTVQLGHSQLGRRDLLRRFPGLDPRLEDGDGLAPTERPVADAGGGRVVELGATFTLDARASHAPAGRPIVRYLWQMLD